MLLNGNLQCHSKSKLTVDDWLYAALQVLEEDGVRTAAVAGTNRGGLSARPGASNVGAVWVQEALELKNKKGLA